MKTNFIREMDKIVAGLAGMFYMLLERDFVRVYREYVEETKRKQAMSAEDVKDQAELAKFIEEHARTSSKRMTNYQHSHFYPKQA